MGSITAGGIGSGLDIEGLVSQLVAAEGQPQQLRLSQREAKLQAQLSAFGQFRSAIEQLQSALDPLSTLAEFQGRSTSVGDPTLLTANASLTAAPGSYQVEVVRLAQAQKLASGPFASAADAVGWGDLEITVGGVAFTISVAEDANSLADIAAAINGAPDNTGVRATLITANDGVRLVLTSAATGLANTVTLAQSGGDGGLAQITGGLTQLTAPQDAQVLVEGFAYDSPDNVITEVISGLTLTLTAAAPGSPTTVTVDNDGEGTVTRVENFVKAYNSLVESLKGLTAYNAATQTGGPLLGDSTARSFLNSIRSEVTRVLGGGDGFSTLAELGVTTQVDGSLVVDSSKLGEALADDFDGVGRYFSTAETGLASRLDTLLARYADAQGLLDARTDGLQSGIADIAKAREALDFRLQQVEQRLRRQFGALDTLVAQLRVTSDFLTRQLDTLLPTNQQKTG
jgi:flagellar hook-associated protein 2